MSDIEAETARSLLRDLVETPSVSGSEAACADRLLEFCDAHGREAWIDDVGNVRAPGDESVLMTSHMDTVPGEIPVRVENGHLWGRGSVDAKGPLVAMAVAAVETGTSFAGVVREESDSAGARHLVADRDPPEAVINGEPSGWDAITLGYRGILSGSYQVETDAAHSSRPERNAIQNAIGWWHAVEDALVLSPDPADGAVFDRLTAKPTEIDGGKTEDGLTVDARLAFQIRVPPTRTTDEVQSTVEAVTESGSIEWSEPIAPVMRSPRNPVARALRRGIRDLDGNPSHLRKTGTSDMNVLAEGWDVPMATYGPGDSALDHTPEERLSLREFDRAVGVLRTAGAALAST